MEATLHFLCVLVSFFFFLFLLWTMLVTCVPLHERVSRFLKFLETDFLCLGCVHFQLNKNCQVVLQSGESNLHPSVQFSSVTQSCLTLYNPMDCSTPAFSFHHQLLELTQTRVHWVHDAIQPSHLLSSPSPPSFNLSQHQGLFKGVSFCIRWPKYWSFSFSISPSNEYSGLISFRIYILTCKLIFST